MAPGASMSWLMQYSSTFSFGQHIPHVASSCCGGRRCCNDKSYNFFSANRGEQRRKLVHRPTPPRVFRVGCYCFLPSTRVLFYVWFMRLRCVSSSLCLFFAFYGYFLSYCLPLCLSFHFPFPGYTINFLRLTHFCLSCLPSFLFSLSLHFLTLSIFHRLLPPRSAVAVWHWRHRATGCEMSYIIQY